MSATDKEIIVVFESCSWVEIFGLFFHKFLKGRKVYILEAFHAFHHRNVKLRFFPRPWSRLTEVLIKAKVLNVVRANEISPSKIFFDASERAVESVESLSHLFYEKDNPIFLLTTALLGSFSAERVFKTNLVNQLAEFYSTSNLILRLQDIFPAKDIIFFPAYSVNYYSYLETKLTFSSRTLSFSRVKARVDWMRSLVSQLVNMAYVICHVLIYSFRMVFRPAPVKSGARNDALIGIALLSWDRQLEGAQKSLSFLVDNQRIFDKDVLYFSYFNLSKGQRTVLQERALNVYEVENVRLGLCDILIFLKSFCCVLQNLFNHDDYRVKDFLIAIKNYLIWNRVLRDVHFSNFVTHADFGVGALGRNRALKEAGIHTWYYTDSANQLYNFANSRQEKLRHPIFCFLDYDHFVTWSGFLADYFTGFPGSFRRSHVVGCLWSDYVRPKEELIVHLPEDVRGKIIDKIVLAVFDSTYTCNSFTSYQEGLKFVGDIRRLVDDNRDVCVLWREKKKRSFHSVADGYWGPKLVEQYEWLEKHPRVINAAHLLSSGQMNSLASLVISFPFTSTTFEALSAGKKAIWHDAEGLYVNCPHIPRDLRTHGYLELAGVIDNLRANMFPADPSWEAHYRDPYQGHGAIGRFQDLLLKHSSSERQT